MSTVSVETELPGLPPPPGVIPNFIDPFSMRPYLFLTVAVCTTASTFFVWSRVYTKLCITRSIGWEDYTCVLSWIGLLSYMFVGIEIGAHGGGVHQWDVPLTRVIRAFQLANYAEIIYGPSMFLAKFSILLQFQKIFVPTKQGKTYYAIHLLIWFNLLYYVAATLVLIFACNPRHKIWDPMTPGHCINFNSTFIATAAINVVSDFSILILPLYTIWHLQMENRKKVGVSAVFGTGLLTCITSVIRLFYSVNFMNTADSTYALLPLGLWSFAEITTALLCGCLPVLPKFFQHIGPKVSSKLSSYGGSKTQKSEIRSKDSNSSSPRPGTPWQDPYHPRQQPKHNYPPLDELDEQAVSQIASSGIKGGRPTPSNGTSTERMEFHAPGRITDIEHALPPAVLPRTVRVETDTHHEPTAHHGTSFFLDA